MYRISLSLNAVTAVAMFILALMVVAIGMGEGNIAAALAATFAAMIAIDLGLKQEAIRRSEFVLSNYERMLDDAVEMITNGEIERAYWNMIARTLEGARRLEKDITHEEHRAVMAIRKTIARHRILDRIKQLRQSDFFGMGDQMYTGIADLAQRSHAEGIKWISENAIAGIMRFAEFPEDYNDPLDAQRFSERQMDRLRIVYGELYSYLRFHDQYFLTAYSVTERETPRSRA